VLSKLGTLCGIWIVNACDLYETSCWNNAYLSTSYMMRGKSQVIALLYFILLFYKCGTKNLSHFTWIKCDTSLTFSSSWLYTNSTTTSSSIPRICVIFVVIHGLITSSFTLLISTYDKYVIYIVSLFLKSEIKI